MSSARQEPGTGTSMIGDILVHQGSQRVLGSLGSQVHAEPPSVALPIPLSAGVPFWRRRFTLINPADAVYFYMDSGILRIRVENETYWVNYQLGELEEALEDRGFFRAHRSSLVNLSRVKEVRLDPRSSIVLVMNDAKNSEIEVSERQARILRARIPGL